LIQTFATQAVVALEYDRAQGQAKRLLLFLKDAKQSGLASARHPR
jgi:hypothetical protein